MSALPRPERLVTLSLAIYQALLVLYPQPFRRVYAAEMARVFRDSCRAATQRDGVAGLARMWRVALGDLLITALAERMEQDVRITRSALYRAASLISLIGVVAWIVGLPGRMDQLAMLLLGPAVDVALLSARWIFFTIGAVGLYAWLSARRGALVWIPGAVAITTLTAMSAVGLFWIWATSPHGFPNGFPVGQSLAPTEFGVTSTVVPPSPTPFSLQISSYASMVANLGYPAIGLAFLASGLMTLSTPTLRGVSRLLLLMGVVSGAYYFFQTFAYSRFIQNLLGPYPNPYTLTEIWLAGVYVFTAVWVSGWLLLGRWLWQAGGTAEPAVSPADASVEVRNE